MQLTFTDYENDHLMYQDLSYALSLAKALPPTNCCTLFHLYWRVPRDFGEKQAIALKSLVASQNLTMCRIIVWSNVDLSGNPHMRDILPFVELRIYDARQEAQGTLLEGWSGLDVSDEKCWFDGDIFRLLVLHKYGGIYIDFDMIVLRDMSPLYGVEFMYQWGSSRFPTDHIAVNGAAMGVCAGSPLSIELLQEVLNTPISTNGVSFGRSLYRQARARITSWYILPCAFFNTEWLLGWSALDFMKQCPQSTELFDGAFTWHWHNQWDVQVEEGSKFWILAQRVNQDFEALCRSVASS